MNRGPGDPGSVRLQGTISWLCLIWQSVRNKSPEIKTCYLHTSLG